jgi:hypothetical protein
MDFDELFEDDVEEVIDDPAGGDYTEADDASDEDTGIHIEGNENFEGNNTVRDDSAYVFSQHKGTAVLNF